MRTIFVGISRAALTWRPINRSGKPGPLEIVRGEPRETLAQIGPQMREATEEGWCAISVNSRYVISLETNLSRRAGTEDMLKTNPRSVLGGRYERGKTYAVTHNPETNSSILLACDEEQNRKIETMFKEAGFQVGRLCCGTYILLRHALTTINTTKGSEKPVSSFIIVCCEGAVLALVQDQDRWLELRSRTDVYEDDPAPITDLLAPFHSRLSPDMGITLVSDEPIPGLADQLSAALPNRPVVDLSQPALLANLMLQN
ncbi:MAG: hypothetical protein SFU53_15820 [Terrimicrobiaceae bacterium]|nr:hypothetical protein [Terrimicrobiaceae bacterium]